MKKLIAAIIIFGILIAFPVHNAHLIPESAIMMLLGVSMVVLSVIGRKRILK